MWIVNVRVGLHFILCILGNQNGDLPNHDSKRSEHEKTPDTALEAGVVFAIRQAHQ
jgi:hypothetical protein